MSHTQPSNSDELPEFIDVVAEGVETLEQRKLLSLLRCDQMQEFLYSAAVDRNGVAELIVAPERRHQSARSRR